MRFSSMAGQRPRLAFILAVIFALAGIPRRPAVLAVLSPTAVAQVTSATYIKIKIVGENTDDGVEKTRNNGIGTGRPEKALGF